MEFNFLAILVAALSSFVVGFIWYNPKVFGTIWMKEIGMTEEQAQKGKYVKDFRTYICLCLYVSVYDAESSYSPIWSIEHDRRTNAD